MICRVLTIQRWVTYCQWIGLREILPETPITFMGKTTVSGSDFPVNQSIEFLGDDKKKAIDGCENLGIIACVKNKGVEWFWLFDPCEDRNDDGDVSCNIQQESPARVRYPAWCCAWCFAEESEFGCKHISIGHKTRNNQMWHTPVKSISTVQDWRYILEVSHWVYH